MARRQAAAHGDAATARGAAPPAAHRPADWRQVPFNINPHYLDPEPDSTHLGESRETRIREFLAFNPQPVLALREGALLEVAGSRARLEGSRAGRLFRRGADAVEIEPRTPLDFLLAEE